MPERTVFNDGLQDTRFGEADADCWKRTVQESVSGLVMSSWHNSSDREKALKPSRLTHFSLHDIPQPSYALALRGLVSILSCLEWNGVLLEIRFVRCRIYDVHASISDSRSISDNPKGFRQQTEALTLDKAV